METLPSFSLSGLFPLVVIYIISDSRKWYVAGKYVGDNISLQNPLSAIHTAPNAP